MNRPLLEAALKSAQATVSQLKTALADLDARANGTSPPPLKQANGRLSEAGVRLCRTMLDADRSPSEIARELDVTVPAVLNQRNRYLAEKRSSKRKHSISY